MGACVCGGQFWIVDNFLMLSPERRVGEKSKQLASVYGSI